MQMRMAEVAPLIHSQIIDPINLISSIALDVGDRLRVYKLHNRDKRRISGNAKNKN